MKLFFCLDSIYILQAVHTCIGRSKGYLLCCNKNEAEQNEEKTGVEISLSAAVAAF